MKNFYYILIFSVFILLSQKLFSQDDKLAEIKKHYYAVEEMINACDEAQEPEECSLYKNEIILNSNGRRTQNWPAVGFYYEKFTFWYQTAPAHWDDNKGESALLKVIIENDYAAYSEYSEYLYKDAELVFCFFKSKDISENRFYYYKNKLIDYKEKKLSNYAEVNKNDAMQFLEQGKNLQKKFYNMF